MGILRSSAWGADRRRGCRTLAAVICAACVLGLTSCGDDASQGDGSATNIQPEEGHEFQQVDGFEPLRFESLTDLVSFADHVAVISVEGEQTYEPELSEEVPEGFVEREVELRVVEDLYAYPGAPDLPTTFQMGTLGSFVRSDGTIVDLVGEGDRLQVGSRYVVGLRFDEGGDLAAMTSSAVMLLDGDIVAGNDDRAGGRAALSGLATAEVRDRLAVTPVFDVLSNRPYESAIERREVVDEAEIAAADTSVPNDEPPGTGVPTTLASG